jgi:putative DNA-invertase from lambdoid prophage Rac
MMSTVLYARVSTTDQTLTHQKTQAEQAGFVIDQVVSDHGVSGVSTTLRERPEGRRLYDMLRRGDTLVVRWVDRLGRNYSDVTDAIREFMSRGVVVKTVINGMTFDGATTDPIQMAVRDALIGFMAATAQAQHEATKASQRAGIDAAKAEAGTYLGRKPSYDRSKLSVVLDMLSTGSAGTSDISRATGLSRQTVLRIKSDPAKAEATLAAWEAGGVA